MRGEITDTVADEAAILIRALVPAATSMDYPTQFASVTHGKGSMSTSFHGYRECPDEPAKTMPRRGVDRYSDTIVRVKCKNAFVIQQDSAICSRVCRGRNKIRRKASRTAENPERQQSGKTPNRPG